MSDNRWAAVAATNLCTLATIKRDGRPQLSDVNCSADDSNRVLHVSTRGSLAKVHKHRRRPGPPGLGYFLAQSAASKISMSFIVVSPAGSSLVMTTVTARPSVVMAARLS